MLPSLTYAMSEKLPLYSDLVVFYLVFALLYLSISLFHVYVLFYKWSSEAINQCLGNLMRFH